jgi:hypothetical protein
MKTHLNSKTVVVTLVLAFGGLTANAQNVRVDSQETQLLLAASSTTTLQQELDKAGALGFRVVMGTTRGNGELVVLLERDIESNGKSQLRLVATNATGTFQQEINELARQGYRAVPQSFLNKPTGLIGNEIVVIMERTAKPARRYEYKLIATNQTSVIESEWQAASRLGYKSISVLTRAEVMLLAEREAK